ncbi:TetR family transcriptional regulator [Halomonas sp. SF2003]|nr:TetR family transcriptional regulator [Halomonas sp. SF2003]
MNSSVNGRRTVGRPRNTDSDARRERILEVATDIFSRDGYRSTAMTTIARGAGLSQTGLLHHFPNKNALLNAVMTRRDSLDWLKIDLAGTRARGWDYIENLVSLVENNQENKSIVKLFTTLSGEAVDIDHPANQWLLEHHQSFSNAICQALKEAMSDGVIDANAPVESIARTIMAVMDGLQIQWLSNADYTDMSHDFSLYIDTVRQQWQAPCKAEQDT